MRMNAQLHHDGNAKEPKSQLWLFCQEPGRRQQVRGALDPSGFDIVPVDTTALPGPGDTDPLFVIVDATQIARGTEIVAEFRMAHPACAVLAIVTSLRDALVFPLLRLGVKGLIVCSDIPRDLARAASMLRAGGYWISRMVLSRFVDAVLPDLKTRPPLAVSPEVTSEEREVLHLALDNLSVKEIAKRLSLSEQMVNLHISRIFRKFRVGRTTDLILLWLHQSDSGSLIRSGSATT